MWRPDAKANEQFPFDEAFDAFRNDLNLQRNTRHIFSLSSLIIGQKARARILSCIFLKGPHENKFLEIRQMHSIPPHALYQNRACYSRREAKIAC